MRQALALLLLLVATSVSAQPTSGPTDLLRSMGDAVARLDYETAEARAREALARYEALTPDQLVSVHTTLGVLLHARNEPIEARAQFEAALSLRPDLTLDPVLVSPKTLQFFDEVRVGRTAETAPGPAATPEVRYVVVRDERVGAALRSLALPGWGQFHKGDRAKGWAFALGAGALAAGTLTAEAARANARAAYLDAGTQADAVRLYGPYDRWRRTSVGLARATALAWAAATLDALATGGPEAVALRPAPEVGGVRLRVRL